MIETLDLIIWRVLFTSDLNVINWGFKFKPFKITPTPSPILRCPSIPGSQSVWTLNLCSSLKLWLILLVLNVVYWPPLTSGFSELDFGPHAPISAAGDHEAAMACVTSHQYLVLLDISVSPRSHFLTAKDVCTEKLIVWVGRREAQEAGGGS